MTERGSHSPQVHMTAELISVPRQWITPLMGFHLPSFYTGDIHSPHHVLDIPWLKVKTELPCLTTGTSLTTLCSVILSPTTPPSDALPRARSPALSLKRNTDIMKSWTVLKACHSVGGVGGGRARLGTLGPHKAHEIAVPSKAFGEGKQAPSF